MAVERFNNGRGLLFFIDWEKKQFTCQGKTITIPAATREDFSKWMSGMLIQNAMPNLIDDEREFLISGIAPWEWDLIMGKEK